MNARQIWEETSKILEKIYEPREAANITYLLLEDLFSISREDIMLLSEVNLDQEKLSAAIKRLLNHEPIQHVTGICSFYGHLFHVSEHVLIPRPETEELVDLIIKSNNLEHPKILDIGVGSGCIAISLALALQSQVYGTDISEAALKMAKKNAAKLGAAVKYQKHDVLTKKLPYENLDIIVSNPPYIPESDKAAMHANVLKYEPELALFVPIDDPLVYYKAIAKGAFQTLKNGGKLYFEIHENFGEEVKMILHRLGYQQIFIHADMQGKNRMISATKQENPH